MTKRSSIKEKLAVFPKICFLVLHKQWFQTQQLTASLETRVCPAGREVQDRLPLVSLPDALAYLVGLVVGRIMVVDRCPCFLASCQRGVLLSSSEACLCLCPRPFQQCEVQSELSGRICSAHICTRAQGWAIAPQICLFAVVPSVLSVNFTGV